MGSRFGDSVNGVWLEAIGTENTDCIKGSGARIKYVYLGKMF